MTRKPAPHETDALKRARARLEQTTLATHGGTGRVLEDRREPCGYRVDLRVLVDEIREPGTRVRERLPESFLAALLDDPAEEPWTAADDAQLEVTLSRDVKTVRVKGEAQLRLRHTCVRCLEPVPFDLDLDLDLRLVPASDPDFIDQDVALDFGLADALEEDAEAVDLGVEDDVPFDGRTVDLGAVLREQIFLELPMHPTCESEGARPEGPCQVDPEGALAKEQARWQDPRWAGLLALKDRFQS